MNGERKQFFPDTEANMSIPDGVFKALTEQIKACERLATQDLAATREMQGIVDKIGQGTREMMSIVDKRLTNNTRRSPMNPLRIVAPHLRDIARSIMRHRNALRAEAGSTVPPAVIDHLLEAVMHLQSASLALENCPGFFPLPDGPDQGHPWWLVEDMRPFGKPMAVQAPAIDVAVCSISVTTGIPSQELFAADEPLTMLPEPTRELVEAGTWWLYLDMQRSCFACVEAPSAAEGAAKLQTKYGDGEYDYDENVCVVLFVWPVRRSVI